MPGNPLTDPKWASEIADAIDLYVGKVRTAVTERAVIAVRAVVFGVVIVLVAPVAVTLFVIMFTKLLQRLIAIGTDHATSVWISYVLLGAIFMIAGFFLMRGRHGLEEEQA